MRYGDAAMTALAPLLEAFFLDRLLRQQQASPNTIASYRDTFRLLLAFAKQRLFKAPSALLLSDIDAPFVGMFLEHLETKRNNSVRTRNARLAAIHSFFHFIALREPAHSALIQRVLAIPNKRFDRNLICFLTRTETDALLGAPEQDSWIGCRDHALLLTMIQTGLRVSELINLKCEDFSLDPGAHIRCRGKGRKQRSTPLTPLTVAVLRNWLRQQRATSSEPLFPTRRGGVFSRDAVERIVKKYAAIAATKCPSLISKNVSPHVLRHTTAVQ
ncbi:MAG: tyrosine-type recombinase/integrase, partial [Dehalococcoidia bacterium]